MNNARAVDFRLLLELILTIGLVLSIGFNIYQVVWFPHIERTIDFTITCWLSITGITLGAVYFIIRPHFAKEKQEPSELAQNVFVSLCMRRKEALDAILKDYEITNKEIERRENITLIVGTILVSGSLLILGNTATASNALKFPYAFFSISLFAFWLFVLHLTATKLDCEAYSRARDIEEALKQFFGYDFGVHKYTHSKTKKMPHEHGSAEVDWNDKTAY